MIGQSVLLALRAIFRNTLRSLLTVLGVVIGVAAVITMVTIGSGATAQVSADITKLGANLLIVRPGRGFGPGSTPAPDFHLKDAEAIRAQTPGLEAVAPTASLGATAIAGSANRATTITGTTNDYFSARDWAVIEGRAFTETEQRGGKAVCLLGETVRRELFGAASPLGETIRMKSVACEVIGVIEPKGQSSFGQDQDDVILAPIRMVQRRFLGDDDVATLFVSVREGGSTLEAATAIAELLRERRRIGLDEQDDFTVRDMADVAATMASTTRVLTGLLGAVAAVSLLVGGIGIMNIMLVSVTERTREIGIRLAIGARENQVLMQFLIEAVALSLFGGGLGILLGLGLSALGASALGVPFVIDPGVVALAFLFSAAIGVAFGFFPARRAARLQPIEALRHE